jgi:hypothetical protein
VRAKNDVKLAKATKVAAVKRSKIFFKQPPPVGYPPVADSIVCAVLDVDPAKRPRDTAGEPGAAPAVGAIAAPVAKPSPPFVHALPAPTIAKCPFAYNGGKIYYAKPRCAYRAYARIGDKIEKVIGVSEPHDQAAHEFAFASACKVIDDDERPCAKLLCC